MKKDIMTQDEISKNFGSGTTCSYRYYTLYKGENFSIVYHKSHPEYINRIDGVKTCESAIYIVKNGVKMYYDSKIGEDYKLIYEGGRLNKEKREYLLKIFELSNKNNKITLE